MECLPALAALEVLLCSMSPEMLNEVVTLGEASVTRLTFKGLLSRVN